MNQWGGLGGEGVPEGGVIGTASACMGLEELEEGEGAVTLQIPTLVVEFQ